MAAPRTAEEIHLVAAANPTSHYFGVTLEEIKAWMPQGLAYRNEWLMCLLHCKKGRPKMFVDALTLRDRFSNYGRDACWHHNGGDILLY